MGELAPPVVLPGTLSGRAQPTLNAGPLVLRPWEPGDAAALVEAYADPDIQRWHVRAMDEAESHEWIEERTRRWEAETGVDWAVVEEGTVVGRVGFRMLNLHDGRAEAAYWVLPSGRGRGIAAEALRAASEWMLANVGFHRLEAKHSPENETSCRVAHKAGYVAEHTERRSVLHLDGWHDMHVDVLLADSA